MTTSQSPTRDGRVHDSQLTASVPEEAVTGRPPLTEEERAHRRDAIVRHFRRRGDRKLAALSGVRITLRYLR